jgi:hypothetical protein
MGPDSTSGVGLQEAAAAAASAAPNGLPAAGWHLNTQRTDSSLLGEDML